MTGQRRSHGERTTEPVKRHRANCRIQRGKQVRRPRGRSCCGNGRNHSLPAPGGQAVLRRIVSAAVAGRGPARRVRVRRRRERHQRQRRHRGPHGRARGRTQPTRVAVDANGAPHRHVPRRAVRRARPTGRCTTSPPTRRRACASTCTRSTSGHPGADMNCPARLVGRADAVLVEPTEGERHRGSRAQHPADVTAATGERARGAGRRRGGA